MEILERTTEEVAALCAGNPAVQPYARLVGAWIWVEFPGKPADDVRAFLKGIGFRWNKNRGVWQHACGIRRPRMKSGDPRFYYGVQPIEEPQVSA